MPLIAINREMGSLGMEAAKLLERELGIPVVYHEIIDHLADKLRLRNSHVIRLLSGRLGLLERLTADQTSLNIYTEDELLRSAGRGTILRGWGAVHLLRNVRHAVCVRICAPFETRLERMMERLNTDDAEAVAREIRLSDEAQGAIVRRHFGLDWRDAEQYDLSLNTERLSVEQCAEKIMDCVRDPAFEETEESRAALDNLVLQAQVRAALRADPRTRNLKVGIAADRGRVTLSGALERLEYPDFAVEVARAVPGVRQVVNSFGMLDAEGSGARPAA